MRGRRAVSLLVLIAVMVAMTPIGTGYAVPTVGEPFPVCTASYGQVQPEIDYPWIVWKDERNGTDQSQTDIYAYNLITGEESEVCTAPGEQANPCISGDIVVYSDDRTDPTGVDNSSCDIYGYDLSTGEEFLICDAGYGQGNPFIYGDRVVWVDHRNSSINGWDQSDIYMKDLSTGVESVVCTLTSAQYEPVIWQDYVAYWDSRYGNSSVFVTDLSSGEETCIAKGWSDETGYGYYNDPSLGDGYCAVSKCWYTNSDATSHRAIVLIDLETGEEQIVSSETENVNRRHPVVRDGWVTWHDQRSGVNEVYGYDLAAQEETCLVPAVQDPETEAWVSWAGRTTVGDGIVVWHDHRTEDPAVNEDGTSYDDLYAMYLRPMETVQNPVEGTDRYGTSVQVSEQTFPDGADTVIVTTGANWPDALAAASLAGAYNAPVLLTRPTELPEDIAAEIERLGATDAFILGSTRAVSNGVKSAVEAIIGGPATRLGGADRYETANLIAQETVDTLDGDWDGTAFVATGNNFPDALAASPLSSYTGYPIFLANSDGVSDETQAVMDDLGVTDVYLLGSPGVLPGAAEGQVKAAGAVKVARIAGDTRYETAVGAATFGVEELGMSWSQTAIATGENFPDALSAGPAQGLKGSVMLLTPRLTLHDATRAALEANRAGIWQVDWVGSTSAVCQAVRDAVEAIFTP